jgi:hypothetical protein
MGDIVNLRRARKKAEKQRHEECAADNRLVHGRSKAERELQSARRARFVRDLDQHRLGSGEANEVTGRQTVDRHCRTQDKRQS